MKEQEPDFDDEMQQDEAVLLFKRILNENPSEALDKAVLNGYRQTVQSKSAKQSWFKKVLQHFIPSRNENKTKNSFSLPRYQVGLPLAISYAAIAMVLGIGIAPLMPWHTEQPQNVTSSPHFKIRVRNAPADKTLSPIEDQSRKQWSELIAKIVDAGQISEAQQQLKQLNKRFPQKKMTREQWKELISQLLSYGWAEQAEQQLEQYRKHYPNDDKAALSQ